MQSNSHKRDAIRFTIRKLKRELDGISPKVSLYAKIEREIAEEEKKLKELEEPVNMCG